MTVKRRTPGTRRRRSRRVEELEALREIDPAKADELEALRAVSPQQYRNELRRLHRREVVPKGRGFESPEEALALLALPVAKLRKEVERGLAAGDWGFRAVGGLLEAERLGQARADVVGWLEERLGALLAAENRSLR